MPYTHYIPQWVLRQFKPAKPWELDIWTGRIDDRGLKKAGSGQDLWPADIEANLTEQDTRAAEIYYSKIQNRHRIKLTGTERREFALWLAHFYPRCPNTLRDIRGMTQEARESPEKLFELMQNQRYELVQKLRRDHAELYQQATAEFGTQEGEALLLTAIAMRILDAKVDYVPKPETSWHMHMRTASVERLADILCGYHWTWLYSRHGFVIGDNPLIRWHKKKRRWNFGILRNGVEITFPLSHNLCLHLDQIPRNDRTVWQLCSRERTHEYNRRQRLASIAYVYSGDRKLLEPWRALTEGRDF